MGNQNQTGQLRRRRTERLSGAVGVIRKRTKSFDEGNHCCESDRSSRSILQRQYVVSQWDDREADILKIALDTVIDNVATLAVERCLLDDLPDLIALDDVAGLDDDRLSIIGCEPLEAQEERSRARAQASALEEVIRTCRRHASHQSSQQAAEPEPEKQHAALNETFDNLSVTRSIEKPRRVEKKQRRVRSSAVVHGLATPEASPGNKAIPAIYTPEPEPLRKTVSGHSLFPGVSEGVRRSSDAPQWKYREPASDEEL